MLDLGGTFRETTAADTLKRVEPLLFDTFGITRVANVTGLDNIGISTYLAIRPLSKCLTVSQGKGITPDLAKVSAIMESIETWHSENLPPPDLFGSFNELRHHYNLLEFTPSITRDVLLYTTEERNDLPMPWLKATELFSQKEIYIPRPLINLDFTNRGDTYQTFSGSSNGLASGNSFEEALCHALYEVIERDCETDFSSDEGRNCPIVNLKNIEAPHIKALLEHFNQDDLTLLVHDMTNRLQIPAFSARVFDSTGTRAEGVFRGSGCHLSSVVALSRAITEAIQSKLTFITGSRDDTYPIRYKTMRESVREALQSKKTLLQPPESADTIDFVDVPAPSSFSSMIEQLLSQLKQQDVNQVVVYDHTRPDIGISVVRAIVPGLMMESDLHAQSGYSHSTF